MSGLLANRILLSALLANVLAQIWKVIWVSYKEKRFALERLFETGGMPSSHSAAVASLTTAVGIDEGLDSPAFAISAVFAAIVLHDAAGVRQAAGMQAHVINDLVRELHHLLDEKFPKQVLRTLLGHTVPQVIVGAILGVLVAFLVKAIW